jgi:hypothetical protein
MLNRPKEAFENFNFFESKLGSDHIATFSSQLNLLDLLTEIPCKAVLDFGSGIGTLTKLAQSMNVEEIVSYERSEWCKIQALSNLRPFIPNYVTDLTQLPMIEAVFIDDEISRLQIRQLLRQPTLKVIFIEGWRNKTASQVSHRLVLHGYSASFCRGKSRWNASWPFFLELKQGEKAGCWFVLKKQNLVLATLSWLRRIRATGEIQEVYKEFFFWVSRNTRLRSRCKNLTSKLRH